MIMAKIKTAILMCLLLLVFLPIHKAAAACSGEDCLFPNCPSGSAVCADAKSQGKNNPVVGNDKSVLRVATNIVAIVGGIAAVITIIISGLMYATAGGSPVQPGQGNTSKVKKAQTALIGGVVGLAVIVLAYAITNFVIDHFVHT
jgi:hypothetical protein